MTEDEREIQRKLRVIKRAEELGSDAKAYRYFGIPRSTFYRWRKQYLEYGEQGLTNKKPIPNSHPNRTPDQIVEKILHLRKKYHLGPIRIMWYMARYHDLRVSDATIYRILKRHGLCRLPGNVGRRKGRLRDGIRHSKIASCWRIIIYPAIWKTRSVLSSTTTTIIDTMRA